MQLDLNDWSPTRRIFPSRGMTLLRDLPPQLRTLVEQELTLELPASDREPDQPSYVELWRDHPGGILVPRYYWNDRLNAEGVWHLEQPVPFDCGRQFHGTPRPDQVDACNVIARPGDRGLKARCGWGKTWAASYVGSHVRGRMLIRVPNENKMSEWRREMKKFFGLRDQDIGIIQAEKFIWDRPVVLAMVNTVALRDFSREVEMAYDLTIDDEIHLSTTRFFSRALGKFGGRRLILTATPPSGVRQRILDLHVGGEWFHATSALMRTRWEFLPVPVRARLQNSEWQRLVTLIGHDYNYVDVAGRVTQQLLDQGRRVLVVNHQIEPLARVHQATGQTGGFVVGQDSLKTLAGMFHQLRGTLDAREERSWPARASAYMEGVKARLNPILGIGLTSRQPAGTGMDVPNLDGGVVMLPVASATMAEQLHGRWARVHEKQDPLIVVMVPDTEEGRKRARVMEMHLRRLNSDTHWHPPLSAG